MWVVLAPSYWHRKEHDAGHDHRGWTASQLELTKIHLLDLVSEAREEDGGVLRPFLAHELVGGNVGLATDAIGALAAESLVRSEGRGGGGLATVWISEAGSAAVRVRQERRLDRKQRVIACPDALLDWAYKRPDYLAVEDFAGEVQAHFEGDPFSREEIETAAGDLEAKGLVEGVGVAEATAPSGSR